MFRWSNSNEEARHIVRITRSIPAWSIIEFTMKNGKAIEGVTREGGFSENNRGEGGLWKVRSGMVVEDLDGTKHAIDFLDVQSAKDVFSARREEYHRKGLIAFLDYPGN
jgi:hypothetical protein